MLRFEFENDDSIISSTFKNSDVVTWPEIISMFADTLVAATYVIDKEILEAHLEAAAEEMRQAVYAEVAARNAEVE